MLQGFFGRQSLIWIQNKQFGNHIPSLGGNISPILLVKLILSRYNLPEKLLLTAAHEWQGTTQQQEHNAPHRPHVRLLIIRLFHENFGRHKEWCTALFCKHLRLVAASSESKVSQLDGTLLIEDDVFGLDVPVNDRRFQVMDIFQSLAKFSSNLLNLSFCKPLYLMK